VRGQSEAATALWTLHPLVNLKRRHAALATALQIKRGMKVRIDSYAKHAASLNSSPPTLNLTTLEDPLMAETGHARNVERFTQLLSFVTSYGADYAPSNTKITIPNLQAKLTASLAAIDGVSTYRAGWIVAVNERQNTFADLRQLTTRVVNAFAASGAPENAVDDAKALKRKINGVRAKALPEDNPNTPENESEGSSVSQRSFTQLTEHLDSLIDLLDTSETYAPNETELQIGALQAYSTSLKNENNSVINSTTHLSNKRITRDEALYADGTGLVDLAGLVKKYVKSLYGADSPQYEQISGLDFTRPR
jgi:hypothetical protein